MKRYCLENLSVKETKHKNNFAEECSKPPRCQKSPRLMVPVSAVNVASKREIVMQIKE